MKAVHEFENARDATAKSLAMLRAYGRAAVGKVPLVVFDIDDTLIFDHDEKTARFRHLKRKLTAEYAPIDAKNRPVIDLLKQARKSGAVIHLVTARLEEPETRDFTIDQLRKFGIGPALYETLSLAPESARESMEGVSVWKRATREAIARKHNQPVTLTIGDQWGDVLALSDVGDIDKHDRAVKQPFAIVRVRDKAALWGLKLPARMYKGE